MKMYIVRGVPGSGKSTLSQKLALENNAVICSADDYFVEYGNGVYKFNPPLLGQAHLKCKSKCQDSLSAGKNVVIDNTNTTKKECQAYIDIAKKYGAEVFIVEPGTDWRYNAVECHRRNTHGVPLDAIQRMLTRLLESKNEDC